jgi:hypothetical protein
MGAAFEALGGGGPALGLFVLAYTIGHGGAIVPLPGSAEGGLVGGFTLYGTSLSLSAGGILLYRTFHAGVPFLLGALGLADMSRRKRNGHRHDDGDGPSNGDGNGRNDRRAVTGRSQRQNSLSTSEGDSPSYVGDAVSSNN